MNTTGFDQAVVRKTVDIQAPPETVFEFFRKPELMTKWMGIEAELDPRPGGIYRVQMATKDRDVALGKYLEIDPPRRIVYSFGWVGGEFVPPESTRVEIDLEATATGTRLTLSHHLVHEARREAHNKGWDYHMARLVIAAGGGDPGPDTLGG